MSISYQTLVEAVLSHAEKHPDKPAVGFQSYAMTYRELAEQMKSAAEILWKEYGIRKGDRVMLSAVSRPDYIVCLLAIQYLGGVSMPVDKAALEENILSVYHFAEPKLLLTDTRIQEKEINKVSLQQLYKKAKEMAAAGQEPFAFE